MVSLKKALTIPFVVLTLTLATVIAGLSYQTGQNVISRMSERLIFDVAYRVSQAVDRHMVGSRVALDAVIPTQTGAHDNRLLSLASLEPRMSIATALHTDPNRYIYYGNNQGQFLGVNRLDEKSVEIRIKTDADKPRQFFEVSELRDSRDSRKPTKVEQTIFDPRERPWYKHAAQTGKSSWASVYVDFAKDELVATRVRPVFDADKKLEGVLATDVSLLQLSRFVSTLTVSANGVAFLIDANGDLIASSSGEALWTTKDGAKQRINAMDSPSAIVRDTFAQFQSVVKQGERIETPFAKYFDSEKGAVVGAIHIIQDDVGLLWYAIVAVPSRDFMGDLSTAVTRSVLIALVAAIVAIMLGLWILNWVTHDLKLLSEATSRVREGKLFEPLAIDRRDEIGQLARSFEKMHIDLQTDDLTGLYNRETFMKLLKRQITDAHSQNQAKRSSDKFGVLFIDLDHFKDINDEHGHLVGNQVLVEVAKRLRTTLRAGDAICRYAGDEFAVIINNVDDATAIKLIADKVIDQLAKPLTEVVGKFGAPVTTSGAVGYAIYPADGLTDLELINVADKRMYRHKWLSR
jgi:diguanylate cyclase (GGDEF)-like protein